MKGVEDKYIKYNPVKNCWYVEKPVVVVSDAFELAVPHYLAMLSLVALIILAI